MRNINNYEDVNKSLGADKETDFYLDVFFKRKFVVPSKIKNVISIFTLGLIPATEGYWYELDFNFLSKDKQLLSKSHTTDEITYSFGSIPTKGKAIILRESKIEEYVYPALIKNSLYKLLNESKL